MMQIHHTVKVKSDKYLSYKEEQKRMMKEMGMKDSDMKMDCEPVDLYGKRVNLDMDDPTNLEETAEDIQDVYGLVSSPNEKKNLGGLASKPSEEDESMEIGH